MPAFNRILFVFPETRYPSGQPPLGIASLSAMAKLSGCEVELCDMSFMKDPFNSFRSMMLNYKPDLIAISIVTPQLKAAVRVAEIIRSSEVNAVFTAGGPHATVLPEDTLRRMKSDFVYSGEGEIAFSRFLETGRWDDITGACWMSGDETRRNPGLLLTEDLDSLPFPDRSIFDMEKYFSSWYSMDRVASSLRGTSVMATRGCPFKCTFCQPTLSAIFGKKIRKRSPENINDELEHLKDEFGINAFMFEDSTFILDHDWVHAICDEMLSRGVELKWCCNVRADLLSGELLDHMKEAGLAKINMGVESASQRVLDDIYNKGITVEGVKQALRLANDRGIFVQGYFMLGAPGETVEEMKRTVDFAAKQPFDDAVFDITTPFPHTMLWDMTKELINRDYSEFDCFQTSVYSLDGIASGSIERMKKRAFLKFYLQPKRIFRTIRTILGPGSLKRTLLKARRV